ncbi:MAG TPA: NAD(P)H-hydrate dehydratase, partial [Candidatus Thermoplasmatota archaeon]|nr:NAD(P)H-hydrate dehydratase [Candidatus Thermoplasmatota archaeon]
VVLGGGVARTPEAHEALRNLLAACGDRPVVVDAEALRAIAGRPEALRGHRALLTPHGGEYEALMDTPWPASEEARAEATRAAAERYGATVIVKGRYDWISDGRDTHRDEAGSPYLTKGGYGDLLAGAAAAYLARGHEPLLAARAAAYLVGTAGARAAATLGESTLASDALARFPEVLRAL